MPFRFSPLAPAAAPLGRGVRSGRAGAGGQLGRAGQGRAGCPVSPRTDAFLAPSVTCPRNRTCPLGLRVLAPFPHPTRVCALYSCAGFCNLTRLCPIVSVHLVVGRNKNHLDFFPDWMIRMYYFLFCALLLFPPQPCSFLLLPSPHLFPTCEWAWLGGLKLLS